MNIKPTNMTMLILLILVSVNGNILTAYAVPWSIHINRLTTYDYSDYMPSITQTNDGKIWIVWAKDILGNYTLFHKTSNDSGTTWSDEMNLTKELAPGHNTNPSIFQAMNGTIWLVWQSNRPPPAPLPEPDFSLDASPKNLTIPQGSSENSTIIVTSSLGFSETVNLSVRVKPSAQGVTTNLDPSQVVPPPNGTANSTLTVSVEPAATPGNYTLTVIGKSNELVHSVNIALEVTVFTETSFDQTSFYSSSLPSEETGYDYEIFCKTSHDNGATWSEDIPLTNNTYKDMGPSIIQLQNGTIMVVWESDRTGNPDIFFKTTLDGVSWSDENPIITDPGLDKAPSVMQAKDGRIWVVWSSNRTGDYEIFSKIYNGTAWSDENNRLTNSTNSDSGPVILQTLNGTIWVFWSSRENSSTATNDIYYKVSLSNGDTWSGSIQFTTDNEEDIWPATTQSRDTKIWVVWVSNRGDQPNGNWDIYYRTSLAGDVNSDGIVDVSDLNILTQAYGSSEGESEYNTEADLNSDGVVNVFDLAIIGKNYGAT